MEMTELLPFFKEFGVVGLMFYSLWMLIKEIKSLNESSDKRISEQSDRHAEERKLWRESYDKNTEALDRLFEKPCQTVNRFRATDRQG